MAEDYGDCGTFKNPKNLEEWFHNREVEERMTRHQTHMSILKELYSNAISDLVWDTNSFSAKKPNK